MKVVAITTLDIFNLTFTLENVWSTNKHKHMKSSYRIMFWNLYFAFFILRSGLSHSQKHYGLKKKCFILIKFQKNVVVNQSNNIETNKCLERRHQKRAEVCYYPRNLAIYSAKFTSGQQTLIKDLPNTGNRERIKTRSLPSSNLHQWGTHTKLLQKIWW